MNSEDIKLVTELIEKKDSDQLKEVIKDLHPADIAELCNELDAEDARFIYLLLDNETAADVLIEMDEDARKKFLEILPPETIAKRFVDYMDSDDAVDIIREMDEDKQEEVLSHIEDIEQAGDIVDLLKYDEDTAGGLMGTEMVIVNENWSMPECLREMRLQAEEMDEIYYVYVVDDDERLRGVFPLKKMITSPSVSKVKHVMKKDPISVHVDTPIEEVVQAIEKYDLVAVPVVDSIGRLVGRITVDDVMDEVREQAERDYQLASGLSQDVETDDNVFRQTTARLPWLLIGMLGGIGNSMILGNFDSTFAAHPEMALYSPYRWNGRKRRNPVLRIGRARSGQQLTERRKHLQAGAERIRCSPYQRHHHFHAGVYLQLHPLRSYGYGQLFGIHQSVCGSHVCLHFRHPGAHDTGKTENRSGHCHRTVYLHYQRHYRYAHVHGNYRIIILNFC